MTPPFSAREAVDATQGLQIMDNTEPNDAVDEFDTTGDPITDTSFQTGVFPLG